MFLQLQSIFGLDESFYCSYDETEGTSYLMMYGDMPVSTFGTSFEMSYDYGTPSTISGPYADLNITGMSRRYRPGFRQLFYNTKKRKGELFFQIENYESNTWFDNVINYREKLTGYTFGFSNTYRTKKSVRLSSLSWSLGDSAVAGNAEFGDFERNHYQLLQASLTNIWYPSSKWTFIAKANAQLAISPLSQSRIFQIGGMATVRGVSEGLMSAESGYLLNFEGRRLLGTYRNKGRLEAFGFVDHGGVFYRTHPPEVNGEDFLFSTGLGLNLYWDKYLSATVGYGQPLFTAESHKEEYQSKLKHGNGYFTVRVQF
jgi:hemolysin activation/secretion protein